MLRTPEQPAETKPEGDAPDLNIRSARKLENELSAERELRVRAQRTAGLLWRLQSLTAAFTAASTTAQIADAVVDTGLAAIDAHSGALALLNDDGTELTIIRAAGYRTDVENDWKTFKVSDALPLSEAVRKRELVLLDIDERNSRYPALAGAPTGNIAFACVPLVVKDRVLGGLTYSFAEPRLFTDDERSFLLALGQLTAQALERARLYEAEHEALARAEAGAERLRVLAEASDVLASSLEYDQTLQSVARSSVPRLADWCVVDLVEENGSVATLAVEHKDPEKVAWAAMLREKYGPDPEGPNIAVLRVIRSGRPELYEDVTDQALTESARDEEHLTVLRELGMTSVMILPMRARNRVIGAITFVSTTESGRHYSSEDMNLAHEIAQRAAMAVENARLFQEHAHISRTLQRSLLPPHLPEIPGVDVAARYHAAGQGYEVGGDFYDLFKTARGDWAIVLGDVCGKGADAAATTALARHTLRAAAMQTRKPNRVLRLLNEAMLRAEQPFCTIAYARFQAAGHGARLTIACGGHPLPFLVKEDGTVTTFGRPGTLLGAFAEPPLHEESIELHPGDAVVLYTDGVTEARNGSSVLGESGLRAALVRSTRGTADEMADAIQQAALDFQDGDARDDIAIVVVKMRPA